MPLPTKEDLPRSPVNYSSELIKFNELRLKETALTTVGNENFTSTSSGLSYNSTTGETGLLTLLQSAIANSLIDATFVNQIQDELDLKADITYVDAQLLLKVSTANLLTLIGDNYFKQSNYGFPTTKTTNFTLSLSEYNKVVRITGASTITIPTNASVAFPIGTQIILQCATLSDVSVSPAVGVVLDSISSRRKLTTNGSGATLFKYDTNSWWLVGDIRT